MNGKSTYDINKGINKPIEFRGLKAQYIGYLAAGLAFLLIVFAAMYIAGVSEYLSVPVVLLAGSGLFGGVYRYSSRYGQYGLMKALAFRQVPSAIICRSRKVFTGMCANAKCEKDDGDDDRSSDGASRPDNQE